MPEPDQSKVKSKTKTERVRYAMAPTKDGFLVVEVDDNSVRIPVEHIYSVIAALDRYHDLRWNERHEWTRTKGQDY